VSKWGKGRVVSRNMTNAICDQRLGKEKRNPASESRGEKKVSRRRSEKECAAGKGRKAPDLNRSKRVVPTTKGVETFDIIELGEE